MQIIMEPGQINYTADGGDWKLIVRQGYFEIVSAATGELLFGSGQNLNNLADLILAARDHARSQGIDWPEGQ